MVTSSHGAHRRAATSKKTKQTLSCCGGETQSPCCAASGGLAGAGAAERKFFDFMGAAMAEGALPVKTKELIAIALAILAKCERCVVIHLAQARRQGASEQEISEAVWLAIGFGGAPAMLFYESATRKA